MEPDDEPPPLMPQSHCHYDSDTDSDSVDEVPPRSCHVQTRSQRRRSASSPLHPSLSGNGERSPSRDQSHGEGSPSVKDTTVVETVAEVGDSEQLRSNNKAKHHTGLELPPKSKKLKTPVISHLRRFFPGVTDETITKTMEATTQYGTRGSTKGGHCEGRLYPPTPF